MKRNLFLRVASLLMFLSCGEDRENDSQEQNQINQKIIGTWTISNGINVSASQHCSNLGNFVFDEQHKLFENYNSVVNNICITETDSYTYSIDENNKKIFTKNTQKDVLIYTISSLSDKELILLNTEGNDVTKYTFSK